MSGPKTLLQMSGANLVPAKLGQAGLVLIDYQNEYLEGPVAVSGAKAAIASAAVLLAAARREATPLWYIAHKGRTGSLFDRDAPRGQIVEVLAPRPGEVVVEKGLPNAFAGTDLHARIQAAGCQEIIVIGFMTHLCVSSTARAALDLGYRVTIAADACGTRPLPDGHGGTVEASLLNEVALVELSDRFAIISRDHRALL